MFVPCIQYIHVYRWEELNSLAEQRGRLLSGAEQVHKFVRDATETNDRMNEKVREKCIVFYVHTCIMGFLFSIDSHAVSKPNVDAHILLFVS